MNARSSAATHPPTAPENVNDAKVQQYIYKLNC